LEPKCLKWAHMTNLDTSNTCYGQNRGQESNCQFDVPPLKVKNRPDFLSCRWRATYRWKKINEGYNFASNLISIRGFHTKLWAPKVGSRESNYQFDSRPLKVGNRPLPDIYRRSEIGHWKALEESYNFGSDLTLIGGQSREMWAPKVPGVQPKIVSGLLLGSLGKKCHSDVAPAE
jgi:hypothetical protein